MSTRQALETLTKWRQVFAGWQLGTRPSTDPECQAVRDHREVTILLRCEVTALTKVLLTKGLITLDELDAAIRDEALLLSQDYAKKFPGMRATPTGIQYDLPVAMKTMKGWRP